MRQIFLSIIMAAGLYTTSYAQTLPYLDKTLPAEERVEDLLSRMTLEEKVAQMQHIHAKHYDMDGKADLQKLAKSTGGLSRGCMEAFPYSLQQYVNAVYDIQKYLIEETRLGIPAIPVLESLHGVVQDGCTIYPQAIAQAATFRPEMVEEMAYRIALEARSIGAWQAFSPCLDLARELRWGRVEETFGEDPYLVSVNGTAYVRGAQKGGLITTPKHFIAHGSPQGGINLASVAGGKYELYNLYLPPFKMIIDECSPLSIMNCYSIYDGEAVTASKFMLTDLLRGTLGFKGYVYSDWGSIGMLRYFHKMAADAAEASRMAIEAGLDMEASSNEYATVLDMVKSGKLDEKYIDRAVRNILYAKFESGAFDNPLPDKEAWKMAIHTPESVVLAKKMAVESSVLLENNGILPLDMNALKSIAVIGPNAGKVQFGDYCWCGEIGYGTDPLEGITAYTDGKVKINYAEGCDPWSQNRDGFKEAVKAARKSDVALVFVGSQSSVFARKTEPPTAGEGYDLHSLKLPGVQEELVDAICATGTPTVVVLVTGKPFEMTRIKEKVQGLVVQWYAGEEQGNAIAELLFGKENFSGRLPVSFPKSTGTLPCFYNHYPSDKGYYNRKGSIDKPGRDYVFIDPYALYTFGYGLSYSSFEYMDMTVTTEDGPDSEGAGKVSADDMVKVDVKVRNASGRDGAETVQIYSSDVACSMITPVRKLVAFKKTVIKAGETETVSFEIPVARLGFYDHEMKLVVEPGDFKIMACSAADKTHFTSTVRVAGDGDTVESTNSEMAAPTVKGEVLYVEFRMRDIQATVLEGVEVVVDGKTIAKTNLDGRCDAHIAHGSEVRLVKKGYETIRIILDCEGRQDLTMVPAF